MSKKVKNHKIKLSASSKVLRVVAGTLTIIWILGLCFPIYWMLINSLSGTGSQYSKDISLVINPPERYTLTVEYTAEEAQSLGEDQMYLEANSLLWRMHNYKKADIGKTEVIVTIDDEIIASYSLSKSDFEINKTKMWSKNILKHADIERVISTIKDNDWVKVETQDVTLPRVQNINEYCEEMLEDFAKNDDVIGTVVSCTHCASYANLFDNFKTAWAYPEKIGLEGGLVKPIVNTLLVAVATIFLNVTISSAAAYSISKLLPRSLKTKMQLLIMVTGMVSPTITLIPKFQVIQTVGLSDSLWAIILPACASFGAMLLFKGTFDSYPNEILEAARIDGAGEFYLFSRLALPAAKGIVGVQIFTLFARTWNEYFWPSMIIRDENKYTVSLIINYMMNIGSSSYTELLALGFIVSIPTLVVYALFQKFLTYGIDYSGIKG